MCIAVIKKSLNPYYSFFVAFNRDENYNRPWMDINNHWTGLPDVVGYLDIKTNGSWLVFNKNILVFVVNREMIDDEKLLKSRSHLVLYAIQNANSAYQAIDNVYKLKTKDIRPFNIIAIDFNDVFYYTNSNNINVPTRLSHKLIMLNRSYPNDFTQKRIQSNYFRFESSAEPDPDNGRWHEWEKILTDFCVTQTPDTETAMRLMSTKWGTTSSVIMAINKNKNKPILLHKIF